MEDNKNIFSQIRFFKDGIPEYRNYSIEQLEQLLTDTSSGYIKARSLVELAYRRKLAYLYDELPKIENQKLNALFNLSVAQIAALAILDYGNKQDIIQLKNIIKNWTIKYQEEDFIDYLKRHNIDIENVSN